MERKRLYGMGMLAFQRPDRTLVEGIHSESFQTTLLDTLQGLAVPLGSAGAYPQFTDETPEHTLQAFRWEYTRLFVGTQKLLAPPYASVYLDSRRQVMTERTVEIKRAYKRWGMEVLGSDLPDHVAYELEFMYHLVDQQQGVHYQQAVQDQAAFLTHMLDWFPQFSQRVSEHDELGFYCWCCDLFAAFLDSDLAYVSAQE